MVPPIEKPPQGPDPKPEPAKPDVKPPEKPATPDVKTPERPENPLVKEALAALNQADGKKAYGDFVALLQKTKNLDDLNAVADGLLREQEAGRLDLSIDVRNAIRDRVLQFQEAAKAELNADKKRQLVDLNTRVRLHQLVRQTMLHDIRETVQPYTHAVGAAVIGGMQMMEKIPVVGSVLREIRYFFGETVPESTKNAGHFIAKWMEKGYYSLLANSGLPKRYTENARDQLARLDAQEAIKEAIEEAASPTDTQPLTITFDQGSAKVAWKRLPAQLKGINWYDQTQQLIANERKQGNGVAGRPIVVSFDKLRDLSKSQQEVAASATKAQIERIKTTWKLPEGSQVKFEGDRVRAKKETTGAWVMSFPKSDALSPEGDPVSADAKMLRAAIDALPDATEFEIGGTSWEVRNSAGGIGLTLSPTLNRDLLAPIGAAAAKLKASRARAIRLDEGGVMKNEFPGVWFTSEGGLAVLKCNGKMEVAKLAEFLTKIDLNQFEPGVFWEWKPGPTGAPDWVKSTKA